MPISPAACSGPVASGGSGHRLPPAAATQGGLRHRSGASSSTRSRHGELAAPPHPLQMRSRCCRSCQTASRSPPRAAAAAAACGATSGACRCRRTCTARRRGGTGMPMVRQPHVLPGTWLACLAAVATLTAACLLSAATQRSPFSGTACGRWVDGAAAVVACVSGRMHTSGRGCVLAQDASCIEGSKAGPLPALSLLAPHPPARPSPAPRSCMRGAASSTRPPARTRTLPWWWNRCGRRRR